ncbi:MAG: hypothetical protein JWQ35_1800 [Bacteriovoracaceae bacterium]|nr:hypothetical protein [Bacteriovoracaceae bacterium]
MYQPKILPDRGQVPGQNRIRMKRFLPLLLLVSTAASTLLADQKAPEAELVKPEEYSTRRFQEVIDAFQKTRIKNIQEDLIALRAKLIIAERRWYELKEKRDATTPEAEKRELNRSQFLRAAQAEMNHYQTKIARLEEEILKHARKTRAKK